VCISLPGWDEQATKTGEPKTHSQEWLCHEEQKLKLESKRNRDEPMGSAHPGFSIQWCNAPDGNVRGYMVWGLAVESPWF